VNPNSFHIPFAQLADLAEGRLAPEDQASLRSHLAVCPACAEDLTWLERVITRMRTDDSHDAPAPVIARATRLFRSRAQETASPPSLRERVLAVLRFDSAQRPLAFGLRAGQTPTRQLLFSAGKRDLDVRLTQTGETWVVSGQILGSPAKGLVELRGEGNKKHTVLNDLSEFTLSPVPMGRYSLLFHLADVEVEVSDLEIRP
jgi:anti-sigma factor RsiW